MFSFFTWPVLYRKVRISLGGKDKGQINKLLIDFTDSRLVVVPTPNPLIVSCPRFDPLTGQAFV